MEKYFDVEISKYSPGAGFRVYRPASLNNPKDNSVMFVTEGYIDKAESLISCAECLIFWPKSREVPEFILKRHKVCLCDNPRKSYCLFFEENGIENAPETEDVDFVNGAFISPKAVIGENCKIFPGAYIGAKVTLGKNVCVCSGAKLIGKVTVGDNVVIHENTVIGAEGLSTNRKDDGKALTMPQFGGVLIEDNVQIGALTVIARGAIDDTVIGEGSKIDNSCFISHNVTVGKDTFIVGETIMFGSSSTGEQVMISGNSTVREGKHIGDHAFIGMGSVVTKDISEGRIVKGNPAR